MIVSPNLLRTAARAATPWPVSRLWSIRLRDGATFGLILFLLAGAALFFRWAYVADESGTEIVEAEIVGFNGYLLRSRFHNVVLASVRLPDGRIQNVHWPAGGRASHCRAGDRVRLIRYGVRFRVYRDGCYPSRRDPNPPP